MRRAGLEPAENCFWDSPVFHLQHRREGAGYTKASASPESHGVSFDGFKMSSGFGVRSPAKLTPWKGFEPLLPQGQALVFETSTLPSLPPRLVENNPERWEKRGYVRLSLIGCLPTAPLPMQPGLPDRLRCFAFAMLRRPLMFRRTQGDLCLSDGLASQVGRAGLELAMPKGDGFTVRRFDRSAIAAPLRYHSAHRLGHILLSKHACRATPAGLEPSILALKGLRPDLLDEGA